MIKIEKEFIGSIVEQAKDSQRLRKNYNYHQNYEEVVNRMLNALQKDTYVQPHKHENPDKHEIFLILQGKAAILEFDSEGRIMDHIILDAASGKYGVEIKPRTWHTIIALEDGTVVYEVKEGPYSPINDKNFATWAPKEGDPNCKVFNQNLLQKIGYR